MKKSILALSLFILVGSAEAHGYYRHGYWVAPAIVGGVIGYEMSRPRYYEPPVVVVQQPPVYVQQPNPYPYYAPPAGFHWQTILDGSCNCYRNVLIPN